MELREWCSWRCCEMTMMRRRIEVLMWCGLNWIELRTIVIVLGETPCNDIYHIIHLRTLLEPGSKNHIYIYICICVFPMKMTWIAYFPPSSFSSYQNSINWQEGRWLGLAMSRIINFFFPFSCIEVDWYCLNPIVAPLLSCTFKSPTWVCIPSHLQFDTAIVSHRPP